MKKVDVKFGPEITEAKGITGRTILEVTGALHADGPRELLPEGAEFRKVVGSITRGDDGSAVFSLSGILELPEPEEDEAEESEPVI